MRVVCLVEITPLQLGEEIPGYIAVDLKLLVLTLEVNIGLLQVLDVQSLLLVAVGKLGPIFL